MNLPAIQSDIWKLASETQKLQALATLGSLPARRTDEDEAAFDQQTYFVALDGVTRHGLSEAVKRIFQGKLGHAFFPSPPELRMQCDAAMQPHEEYRERARRREAIAAENAAYRRSEEPRSEAEKQRQQERMARFHAGQQEAAEKAAEEARRAEVRERYGMTPECLASIQDVDAGKNWQKLSGRMA